MWRWHVSAQTPTWMTRVLSRVLLGPVACCMSFSCKASPVAAHAAGSQGNWCCSLLPIWRTVVCTPWLSAASACPSCRGVLTFCSVCSLLSKMGLRSDTASEPAANVLKVKHPQASLLWQPELCLAATVQWFDGSVIELSMWHGAESDPYHIHNHDTHCKHKQMPLVIKSVAYLGFSKQKCMLEWSGRAAPSWT